MPSNKSILNPFNWDLRNKLISWGLGIVISIFIIYFIVILIIDYNKYKDNSPYLISGTKIAKTSIIVPGHKLIKSIDANNGIEFTYSVWLYIEDSNFVGGRGNEIKHIFHKGSPQQQPLYAPGVWLYKNKNSLAIKMNTYYSVTESCDVDNIPLNKWVNLCIILINNSLDVYINCNLKKRCKLLGVPKINYGDLYVNQNNGFDGLLSQLRYWNKAISQYELEEICSLGPSKAPCTLPGATPPYLSQDYWMTTGFPNTLNSD